MNKPKITIIAAAYHQPLTDQMIAAATDEIHQQGASLISTIKVPGCFEIPLIAQNLLAKQQTDAIIALGYLEKGATLHGEVIGRSVYKSLIDLQLKYNIPIGLGIIGPGATKDQAEARKTQAARSAVKAVIQTLNILNQ